VGNSSVGIRESAFFGTPSVNIGSRQRGRVRSENVIDTDILTESIKAAVDRQVQHGHYPPSYLYGDGTAGKKIADILSNCDLTIEKQMTY
jgi:UDP-N-acetylglucosamine 2-epimerase